jgi:hypothetical protein
MSHLTVNYIFLIICILYIFYNTEYSSRLSSRAEPHLVEWKLLLLGCTGGGRVTGWESNLGLAINSHRMRIKPRTGHQQSSVLTTKLRLTPTKPRRTPLYIGPIHEILISMYDHFLKGNVNYLSLKMWSQNWELFWKLGRADRTGRESFTMFITYDLYKFLIF